MPPEALCSLGILRRWPGYSCSRQGGFIRHRTFRASLFQLPVFALLALVQNVPAQRPGGTAPSSIPLWLCTPTCLRAPVQEHTPGALRLMQANRTKFELTKENWPEFLETARAKALLYAEGLPNFTCVQTTRRYAGQTGQLSLPTGVSVPSGWAGPIGPGAQTGGGSAMDPPG